MLGTVSKQDSSNFLRLKPEYFEDMIFKSPDTEKYEIFDYLAEFLKSSCIIRRLLLRLWIMVKLLNKVAWSFSENFPP